MLQKNESSVLITENGTPVGVISDKEILRDIIENQKDPAKTAAKDLHYTPLVVIRRGRISHERFEDDSEEPALRG